MALADRIRAARHAGHSDEDILASIERTGTNTERTRISRAQEAGAGAESILEGILGPVALRPRPLSIRHPLEAVGRIVTIGESLAGGVRATGQLPNVNNATFGGIEAIIRGLVSDPREFARGTLQAARSGYNWQDASEEIADAMEPASDRTIQGIQGALLGINPGLYADRERIEGTATAATGLIRGIAYDPITYVPFGAAAKLAGRLVPGAVKAAVRGLRPVRALRRGAEAAADVGAAERRFRTGISAEELPVQELGTRATRAEVAAGEDTISNVVRAREEARTTVFRRVGEEARIELQAGTWDTRQAVLAAEADWKQVRRAAGQGQANTEALRTSRQTLERARTAWQQQRAARPAAATAGTAAPTQRATSAAIRDAQRLAERKAIPEAEAASQRVAAQHLQRIERNLGKEHADEVAAVLSEHAAYRARVLPRAIAAGQTTAAGAEKWGNDYLWRGFLRNQATPEYIQSVREWNPAFAAQLQAENAARAAYGTTQVGLRKGAKEARRLVGRSRAGELGEMSYSARLIRGEQIAAHDAAETFRLQTFGDKWGLTLKQFNDTVPDAAKQWWTVLPDEARWGALRNTPYIPKWLAAHLGVSLEGAGWTNRLSRWASWSLPARPGDLAQYALGDANNIWKWFHSVGNIATQFRNMQTNAALTYLVGKIPAAEVPFFMAEGLSSVLERSPAFRRALRLDAGFGSTFTREELGLWKSAVGSSGWIERMPPGIKQTMEGMSSLYQISEQSSKMAIFLYHTRRGMPDAEAAALAMKAIFDYGDVNRIVNWFRRTGVSPFATYPTKATRALAPAMITDTGRFANLQKTIRAPGYIDTEGKESEEAAQPDWMRGSTMRLPFKSAEGDTLYLNIGYVLPWGPWEDRLGLNWLSMMPLIRLGEDVFRNKSSFTGRQLYDPAYGKAEKYVSIARYVAESLAPSWTVRGISHTVEAIQGRARSRYGADPETASVTRTALGEFAGIRTRPLSVDHETSLRDAGILRAKRDRDAAVRKAQTDFKNNAITEDRRDTLIAGAVGVFDAKVRTFNAHRRRQRIADTRR